MSSSSALKSVYVAVVGVGLVGGEFIQQLLSFPSPNHFHIVSLSSSKTSIFHHEGLEFPDADWKTQLQTSSTDPSLPKLLQDLARLVRPGADVVLVDNTSSDDIAVFYPEVLKVGINIITPNKKAYSAGLTLYEKILAASLDSGARFLNEATVGAGLPIISTLKDLVATGDKVRAIIGIFVRKC